MTAIIISVVALVISLSVFMAVLYTVLTAGTAKENGPISAILPPRTKEMPRPRVVRKDESNRKLGRDEG